MEEYYFLFVLAFIYTVFAIVQDLRKTEVANWLNFSLLAFALAYRAFYAIYFNALEFFVFGLFGFLVFYLFANLFYYGRVFGGGDAKLLIAFGAVIPAVSYGNLFFNSFIFIFALFAAGVVWTLFYSLFLVRANLSEFKLGLVEMIKKYRLHLILSLVVILVLAFNFKIFILGIILLPLYIYLKVLEKTCLIKEVNGRDLMAGDWLAKEVRIGRRVIKKSVHGLSMEEIMLIKKSRKRVVIKYGIPFTPAFLISLMVFAYLFFGQGYLK